MSVEKVTNDGNIKLSPVECLGIMLYEKNSSIGFAARDSELDENTMLASDIKIDTAKKLTVFDNYGAVVPDSEFAGGHND